MAAAVFIRKEPAECRAQSHAEEANRGEPGGLGATQIPMHGQGGHDEGNEPDIHSIERPP